MTTLDRYNRGWLLPDHLVQTRSEPKPLLRGWVHAVAAVAAVAFTVAALQRSWGDTARVAALLAFGISMVLLYSVSAIYHRFHWEGRSYAILHAIDHANIFVKIAGAYTPFCAIVLWGGWGLPMLALVWGLAGLGIVTAVLALRLPRWVMVAQYIAMGWLALPILPQIAAALSIWPVLLLLGAGLIYTLGGAIYALRRPNPLPAIFGFHEIFHLCVVAGNVAVAAVVWLWVLPFTPH